MKKILIPLIALPILFFGLYRLCPQVASYAILKYYSYKNDTPFMHETPVEKKLASGIENSGLPYKLCAKFFELSTPWEILNTKEYSSAKVYNYPNDMRISISEQKDKNVDYYLKHKDASQLKLFFGEENLQSEYNFEKLCLYTTPDQVSVLSSELEIKRVLTIFFLKSILYPGDKIYSFSINDFRLFQFINEGDTNHNTVHIFDNRDQCFEISFINIKQNQVDLILSSIKKIESKG